MKAHIVSLGCPKNLTDTEVMMSELAADGYDFTDNPADADLILVNTCAFIQSAREESEAVIREMKKWGKKLYVAGCLPKIRKQKVERRTWSVGVDDVIDSVGLSNSHTPSVKATPPWYAYVKIAEGCDNHCSYCSVPLIRGKLRLRPDEEILEEVTLLAQSDVKEIIFVAQDTAAHPHFAELLEKTAKIKGVRWIRILYAHPAHVDDGLIGVIAREKKIVKYLDLPIQHASDKILGLMHRCYTRRALENLISKIRRKIPKIALRTSVIVGFPGEGEPEFGELLGFIKGARFERLGGFAYSREKGTPADKMGGQVSEKEKTERLSRLMRTQARVSRELNKKMIGRKLDIIIERAVRGGFAGRSYLDAPEIDGSVQIKTKKSLKPGEIVRARLTGAKTYDLFGCRT